MIFINELRRLWKGKQSKIFLGFIIIIPIAFFLLFTRTMTSTVKYEDGSLVHYSTKESLEMRRKAEVKTDGTVTEERLLEGFDLYKRNLEKGFIKDNLREDYMAYAPMINLIQELAFYPPYIDDFKYDNGNDITKDFVNNFYTIRDKKVEKIFGYNFPKDSDRSKDKITELNKKIEKPFVFSPGYKFWGVSIEHLGMITVILSFVCLIFNSSIFSEVYDNRVDDIIKTTRYGRKDITIAKIFSHIISSILLYFLSIGIYVAILSVFLGTEGLNTSFQIRYIYSVAPMTLKQVLLSIIVGGLVSMLAMSAVMMLISSLTKKPSQSLTLGILVFVVFTFIGLYIMPMGQLPRLLLGMLPSSGSGIIMFDSLRGMDIIYGVWGPYFRVFFNAIVAILGFLMAGAIYNKKESTS
ncbi:ABC transporter permease [Gottschalkia acidurici]|nr:ABC transporter permease subunit [Gottschalkia acidurici]